MIEPETLEKAKSIAWDLGFNMDAGLMRFCNGAIQIYRLSKIVQESNDGLMLDMILLTPEIREVWKTKQILTWENGNLPVVSPQGLIQLKSMRMSGQDQDDIENRKKLIHED